MLIRTAPTPPPAYPLGPWSNYAGLGQGPAEWLQGETVLGGFAVPNVVFAGGLVAALLLFSGRMGRKRRR